MRQVTLHKWVRQGTCGRRQKLRYANEYEADRARDRAVAQRGQPLWTYFCGHCHGWHLTHQPPRQ